MSKYTYTDYDGEGITIERHADEGGLKLDKFGEGHVWINDEDAPRIALEILKASGVEIAGHVLNNNLGRAYAFLGQHVEHQEDAKATEAVPCRGCGGEGSSGLIGVCSDCNGSGLDLP